MEDDIKLLIIEVCARLPYGVKFHFYPDAESVLKDNRQKEVIATATGYDGDYQCVETKTEGFNVRNIKLYLRPLSSMTEEEKEEFKDRFKGFFQYFNRGVISDSRLWDKNEAVFVGERSCSRLVDWLNEHHFDYRGLIEKGLALDLATLDKDD